jgi:hypothetical protein
MFSATPVAGRVDCPWFFSTLLEEKSHSHDTSVDGLLFSLLSPSLGLLREPDKLWSGLFGPVQFLKAKD